MLTARQSAELIYQTSLNVVDHSRRLASCASVGLSDPIALWKLRRAWADLGRFLDEFEAAPMVAETSVAINQVAAE